MTAITKMSEPEKSALPPLLPGHGFSVGDRVELPVYGRGENRGKRHLVSGVIQEIDITFRAKRYKGLAILGDDGCYYELIPEITKHQKQNPPARK